MHPAELIDQLESDGPLVLAGAERADWNATSPGLDWTVRELVGHLGTVHRWAAAIITEGMPTPAEAPIADPPADAELLDWYTAGHRAVLDALRNAPSDLECFSFLPAPSGRDFWARRQAHESAIHRADIERAGGAVTPVPAAIAADGIEEMVTGFARARSRAVATPATIALVPEDRAERWLLTLGGERIIAAVTEDEPAADAVVSGSASDLYLWTWNRMSGAQVSGDDDAAALWHSVCVLWG